MKTPDDNDRHQHGDLPPDPFENAVPIPGEPEESTELTTGWPAPMTKEGYIGLAGDFVSVVEPHSEADPVALLLQFLTLYGTIIGKASYAIVESTKHFMNEFLVLVGFTSKGRKGTSLDRTKSPFEIIDPIWTKAGIVTGLSSGEGLIWRVRDPIEKTGKDGVQVVDDGVADKRLLVVEPELASTLRVLRREGNTLSPLLRRAWESGDLESLTKNSPAKATGAHISLIGHITKDEANRYLDRTEAGNGFGNRFLWACVKRSKFLPEGSSPDESFLAPIYFKLKCAFEFARAPHTLYRDEAAREFWASLYPSLSEGRPGLLGSMTCRAEAHVLRLSCLFALLDSREIVTVTDLQAALAVWKYCEDSARFVFGNALGNPLADKILAELTKSHAGLDRTAIRDLLAGHGVKLEVDQALNLLRDQGLATVEVTNNTGGRPKELWKATLRHAT